MITHASLFSGIGAVDLAAQRLGIQNVFNVEVNPFCRKTLDYWFPDSKGYEDVKTTDFSRYRGQITILSGGFPCQGFSVAGKRLGTDDDRYLWPQMLRAIHEIKPTYVLGENVFGILSMVESGSEAKMESEASLFGESDEVYEKQAKYVTEIIRDDLEREGYALQIFCIPACAVGAPHRRDRIWFIAKHIASNAAGNGSDGTSRSKSSISHRAFADSDGHRDLAREKDNGTESNGSNKFLLTKKRGNATERSDGLSALQRNAADTESGRTGRLRNESQEKGTRRCDELFGERGGLHDEGLPSDLFAGFPSTFPTICERDDGVPDWTSRLTIPFSRWRAEAVKALGNSMVVPVVYEILRAILLDIENDRKHLIL